MSRRFDVVWAGAALLALWGLLEMAAREPGEAMNERALRRVVAGDAGLYMNVRGRIMFVPQRAFAGMGNLSHAPTQP